MTPFDGSGVGGDCRNSVLLTLPFPVVFSRLSDARWQGRCLETAAFDSISNMTPSRFLITTLLLAALATRAADTSPPVANAVRTAAPPRIDGRLDESNWQSAPAITSFTQRDPDDGNPTSHSTAVRILYDDEAIYVGARIENTGPISFRLGRRDMEISSSDWFRVCLDTYFDRRNAVRFEVNPGGVRRDSTLSGDYMRGFGGGFAGADGEHAWDPVWDAATQIDNGGWTAELRIPFSQLRFAQTQERKSTDEPEGEALPPEPSGSPSKATGPVWGIQFETVNAGRQEYSLFAYTSKAHPGGVSEFGTLKGLQDVRSSKPFEFIPYVEGQARFDSTGANALTADREFEFKAGLDARYRITSNLTLTAAVNPDFGQVEVDPAVINLTAFETRFEEKRPFFVEGAGNFRIAPGLRSFYAARELMYTRRIGRAPQIKLPSDVRQVPVTTDIIAAAKLTGRTEAGWTIGLLDALTDEMHGLYLDDTGARRSGVVEPRTNYLIGRVSREARSGETAFGAMGTAVNRDLGDARAAAALSKSAYTGGIDLGHDFLNKVWNISSYLTASQVSGTPAAITSLQRASSRYYQRPDAESFRLDPGAKSLSGTSGQVQLSKRSGRHWDGNFAYLFVSPDYEINDVGFYQRVDRKGASSRITYNERTPGRFFRSTTTNFYCAYLQNYDGDWLEKQTRLATRLQHLDFWTFEIDAEYMPERIDDRLTRGGPVALKPAYWSLMASWNSDARKPIVGGLTASTLTDDFGGRTSGLAATFDFRASQRWSLSLSPRVDWTQRDAQYVNTVSDPHATGTFGRRHIFAPLEQSEASLVARLNYGFSANLTLELYAQGLVADGDYGDIKEFLQPRGYRFATYGREAGTINRAGTTYTVDPDGSGPANAFAVKDLSFTSRSLRVNAVLRWEFRPGSTLYAVWQQERLNPLLMENFSLSRATTRIFDAESRNVFAVKMSYWFNL